jgi:hypothetical protein
VIYNLRLVILETLRVFQALWKKKITFLGWAVELVNPSSSTEAAACGFFSPIKHHILVA